MATALLCAGAGCARDSVLERASLGTHAVAGGKAVTRVEVQRLTLPPGFKAGPHTHPGPVVCYVTEGRILFQVKGHPASYYTAGQTIFEPASTPIERFDNDSSSAPATFIATYLLGDQDTELLHRLQ
ncbi:cupin domain-containing protein [Sorangium sp. So ce136]|uniref:cupin domain-containing protein n=1 Tax=Sorangium sp. So ce136 TaxID=3133284 RepID=UPI003F1012AD